MKTWIYIKEWRTSLLGKMLRFLDTLLGVQYPVTLCPPTSSSCSLKHYPLKLLLWILRLVMIVRPPIGHFKLCKDISYHWAERKCSLKRRRLQWSYAALKLIKHYLGGKTMPRSLPIPIWQRASAHQASHVYTIVLASLAWDLKQYVNNGPSPSEAEPSGVDNWEVLREDNPILRRYHQRVPWYEYWRIPTSGKERKKPDWQQRKHELYQNLLFHTFP